MKKFTLKDFVNYNSPCFSCEELTNFTIGYSNRWENPPINGDLPVEVNKYYTRINLFNGYDQSLSINIDHRTNQFSTNNAPELVKYLEERQLFFKCNCHCGTGTESTPLVFNKNNFLQAIELSFEWISLYSQEKIYGVSSNYQDKQSFISISSNALLVKPKDMVKPISLTVPLLTRDKFRTKEKLLDKLQLYVTFS
jgi:hypothetical protein